MYFKTTTVVYTTINTIIFFRWIYVLKLLLATFVIPYCVFHVDRSLWFTKFLIRWLFFPQVNTSRTIWVSEWPPEELGKGSQKGLAVLINNNLLLVSLTLTALHSNGKYRSYENEPIKYTFSKTCSIWYGFMVTFYPFITLVIY